MEKVKNRSNVYAAFFEYFMKQKGGYYFQPGNLKNKLLNANYDRLLNPMIRHEVSKDNEDSSSADEDSKELS